MTVFEKEFEIDESDDGCLDDDDDDNMVMYFYCALGIL